MNSLKFLIGLCLAFLLTVVPFAHYQSDDVQAMRSLSVQLDGRKKPLDTVAQETITKLYGAATYRHEDVAEDYLRTYLHLWFNTRDWNEEPIILVNYRPLKEAAGLDAERKHFTFKELILNNELGTIAQQAHQKQAIDTDLSRNEREALIVEDRINLLYASVGNQGLPIVPHPTDVKGTWVGLNNAQQLYPPETVAPIVAQFAMMQQTLLSNPANHIGMIGAMFPGFKDGLQSLSQSIYPSDRTLSREVFFNQFHPFAKAWHVYVIAFLLTLISLWIKPWDHVWNPYWIGVGACVGGIGVQTSGFLLRMAIAGRPPVTNMYESVVWVGFGIAAIALLFELTSRSRYYLLAAAPLSVVCLVLADSLPAVLDPSITPLVPVLRDNFWLSIHVPTIALSYASFALALGLGHVALGNYLFAPAATQRFNSLSLLNYRILQVGVLLLTAGIILGGIWAHFSWGRFWGWDPKETWALIALLCYMAPLHGRLVGWLGNFGLNVASVVSFNAVLMAWYGVNFVLGTGLHSYGFGTGGSALIIGGIIMIDLLFVGIAAARHYRWLEAAEALTTVEN